MSPAFVLGLADSLAELRVGPVGPDDLDEAVGHLRVDPTWTLDGPVDAVGRTVHGEPTDDRCHAVDDPEVPQLGVVVHILAVGIRDAGLKVEAGMADLRLRVIAVLHVHAVGVVSDGLHGFHRLDRIHVGRVFGTGHVERAVGETETLSVPEIEAVVLRYDRGGADERHRHEAGDDQSELLELGHNVLLYCYCLTSAICTRIIPPKSGS